MQLKFFNTITRSLDNFIPHNPNMVGLYVCGPTVYDHPHIGNARSAIVYDLLYRFLSEIYGSEKVVYVRNITDIDDKIINRSIERNISTKELTLEVEEIFSQNMEYLNCLTPNYQPRATENLDYMFIIIQKLIDNNFAYVADNHVYFDVQKYKEYTKLSNRKLEELEVGARIEINESKQSPYDFVLWKPASQEEIGFASPFGYGRPGWHIECSAMSYRYLGENFDIHGGGADLIFPHHTNEIAQSCCAFPGSSYAKFWIHNGFVTVNGEKMSKSLGNFITITDLYKNDIDGVALRLALLSTHYRKPLDYNEKTLLDAQKTLDLFRKKVFDVKEDIEEIKDEEFLMMLADDLNVSKALAYMHNLAKNNELAKLKYAMKILGIYKNKKTSSFTYLDEDEILKLIQERKEAKKQKDYQRADNIRSYLLSKNIILEDNKDETKFFIKE